MGKLCCTIQSITYTRLWLIEGQNPNILQPQVILFYFSVTINFVFYFNQFTAQVTLKYRHTILHLRSFFIFGEGMFVLIKIMNFWFWEKNKILVIKKFTSSQDFLVDFRTTIVLFWSLNQFRKYRKFFVFWGKFCDFVFLQIEMFV